jgi:hypothetical protein
MNNNEIPLSLLPVDECSLLAFLYNSSLEMVPFPTRISIGTKNPSNSPFIPHRDFTLSASNAKNTGMETDLSKAIKKAAAAMGCKWANLT